MRTGTRARGTRNLSPMSRMTTVPSATPSAPRRSFRPCGLLRAWVGVLLAGAVLAAPGGASPAPAPAPRPNLLVIVTDDQRFDSLGCVGNRQLRTPEIDRLAGEGVRFRNAFVTTPICCASRASLLTGQYARRHGIEDFVRDLSPAQWAETYPGLLRGAGYRVGFVGKFGVGDAAAIGRRASDFDFWRGRPGQAGVRFIDPSDPSQRHMTARMGDEAIEFLSGCSNGAPFCLSISFNAPHARDGQDREFEPDRRDEALYAADRMPLPATATPADFERMVPWVRDSEARRRWKSRFGTDALAQATLRDYHRLVTGIDREVGRLREELGRRGLADSTVIVFTSDNGWFAGEHGLADKWFPYEESIRVPLILFDPRLPASRRGRVVDALALNLDLAPTLLEWAGIPQPDRMQGRSLVPWTGRRSPNSWRTDFLVEHRFQHASIPSSEGVRDLRWSYFQWLPPNPERDELYDLVRDPLQRRDLMLGDRPPRVLERLRIRLRELTAEAQ